MSQVIDSYLKAGLCGIILDNPVWAQSEQAIFGPGGYQGTPDQEAEMHLGRRQEDTSQALLPINPQGGAIPWFPGVELNTGVILLPRRTAGT